MSSDHYITFAPFVFYSCRGSPPIPDIFNFFYTGSIFEFQTLQYMQFLDKLASLELVMSTGGGFFVRYWINQ